MRIFIVVAGRIVRQKVMASLALGGGKRGGKLLLPGLGRVTRGDGAKRDRPTTLHQDGGIPEEPRRRESKNGTLLTKGVFRYSVFSKLKKKNCYETIRDKAL